MLHLDRCKHFIVRFPFSLGNEIPIRQVEAILKIALGGTERELQAVALQVCRVFSDDELDKLRFCGLSFFLASHKNIRLSTALLILHGYLVDANIFQL